MYCGGTPIETLEDGKDLWKDKALIEELMRANLL